MRPRLPAVLGLAAWLLLAAAPTARATLMRPLSVAELAAHSRTVVRGRILTVEVVRARSGSMPVTVVEMEVLEVLAGAAPGGRIVLSQPGGVKDGVSLDYAGRFRFIPGQEIVVFLDRRGDGPHLPVGLAQGVFTVGPAGPGGRRPLARSLDGVVLVEKAPPVPSDLAGLRRALAALPREVGGGGAP